MCFLSLCNVRWAILQVRYEGSILFSRRTAFPFFSELLNEVAMSTGNLVKGVSKWLSSCFSICATSFVPFVCCDIEKLTCVSDESNALGKVTFIKAK